jgi:hypothetical protein
VEEAAMRKCSLWVGLLVCCLSGSIHGFAQDSISPNDRALLEQLSKDDSVKGASNDVKLKLFAAYVNKSAGVIKARKTDIAGREGQRLVTYFIVDHGELKVIEALFGDPSGSQRLRYIRTYIPDDLTVGYRDNLQRFVPLVGDDVPADKRLELSYHIPGRLGRRTF